MDFELAGDDPTFDLPSPLTSAVASPAPHSTTSHANGTATSRRRKGLPVHRCRFPDWSPASVTALAITPDSFDVGLLGLGGHSAERGVLAVGRANGDVELMVWGGHQGWISWRTLPSSFPLPKERNSRKPTSLLSHLVFTHQTTLSQTDLDLYEGDVEGADREIRRLQREGVRLFGVGGVGSELVEWDWGGPGNGRAVGMVKSTLPTLPPIFAVAASRASSSLAIACEDSTIRILNILDGELELVSKIEVGGPGKVRALSLAWGPLTDASSIKGKERETSPDVASRLPAHYATPAESFLVAGCSNSTIRRFDVPSSGSVVGIWRGGPRMTLDRLKGEHTVVWAVAVLATGSVVSGDSMGNVKFWDAKMGTQTQSFRAHKADVLALAVGSDGTSVFTSGVDQKTVEFRQVTVASSRVHDVPAGRWIQASGRRLHSHDVRAIVISPPYALPLPTPSPSGTSSSKKNLVPLMTSGGLDLSLIFTPVSSATLASSSKKRSLPNPVSDAPSTEFESTIHRRAAYVPQRGRPFAVSPSSSAADAARLLVCRRDRSVGIWRLDDPKRGGSTFGVGANAAPLQKPRWGRSSFELGLDGQDGRAEEEQEVGTTGYEKLVELDLKLQTNLIASAISHDGKWLAVSDLYETKVFRLLWKNGELVPRRQKSFSGALAAGLDSTTLGTGASCLSFTRDSQRLVLASAFGSSTVVVQLPTARDEDFEVVAAFGRGASRSSLRSNGVDGAAHANDGDVSMNGADSASDDDESSSEDDSAPASDSARRVQASVTCLAVSNDGNFVATAYTDRNVHIYDVRTSSLHASLPTPPAVPTWLTFTAPTKANPETTLIVALPSNALLLYGLKSKRFHPWALPLSSRRYNTLMDIREPVLGVNFEPARSEFTVCSPAAVDDEHVHPSRRAAVQSAGVESTIAVVWGANWVAKIDLEALRRSGGTTALVNGFKKSNKAQGRREADRKRAREDDDDLVATANGQSKPEDAPKPLDIRVTRRYQPLVLFDFVGQGELVAVERTWFDVARDLPQAWQKSGQFGT
ncbi:hypothetical protein JCM10908_006563 [Rhodotorula pacifica]|uniref:small subunit rRNA maturation protein UTP4 n=1 Tax=Rhodotorula pacifica TaxID=1495444 RepID=UPI0031799D73